MTIENKSLEEIQAQFLESTPIRDDGFPMINRTGILDFITLAYTAGAAAKMEEVKKLVPKEDDGEYHSDYGEGIQDGFNQFLSELLDKLKTL